MPYTATQGSDAQASLSPRILFSGTACLQIRPVRNARGHYDRDTERKNVLQLYIQGLTSPCLCSACRPEKPTGLHSDAEVRGCMNVQSGGRGWRQCRGQEGNSTRVCRGQRSVRTLLAPYLWLAVVVAHYRMVTFGTFHSQVSFIRKFAAFSRPDDAQVKGERCVMFTEMGRVISGLNCILGLCCTCLSLFQLINQNEA